MRLPVYPGRTGATIVDKGTRLFGLRLPDFSGALDKYTEDMAIDGNQVQNQIGLIPKYDLLSGWEETIEEIQARGDL